MCKLVSVCVCLSLGGGVAAGDLDCAERALSSSSFSVFGLSSKDPFRVCVYNLAEWKSSEKMACI